MSVSLEFKLFSFFLSEIALLLFDEDNIVLSSLLFDIFIFSAILSSSSSIILFSSLIYKFFLNPKEKLILFVVFVLLNNPISYSSFSGVFK
jgi:hypothetical protein